MSALAMRWPDGATRLLGLIGENIAYTGSPAMHNRAAAALGRNVVYLPVSLPAAKVAAFLDVAWHMGAVGFNVTTPHKELVARLLPDCRLGSLNTLYRGEAGWLAASTDAVGFARGLLRMAKTLEEFDEVVILGGGGATSALLTHLCELARPPRVHILHRNRQRDDHLTQLAAGRCQIFFADFDPANLERLLTGKGAKTLLIQATNAPQHGDDLKAFVPALARFQGAFVDLVYATPSALFMAAQRQGLAAQDGEAMLIEQARASQELWFGRAASYDAMQAALHEGRAAASQADGKL